MVDRGCLEADLSGQGIVQRQKHSEKIKKIFILHRVFPIVLEEVNWSDLVQSSFHTIYIKCIRY